MMMKSFMTVAAVATLVSFATGAVPAIAAVDTGQPAYDRSTRTLYIDNMGYYLPTSVGSIKLWDADTATVKWEFEGDRRVIKSYSAERDDDENENE